MKRTSSVSASLLSQLYGFEKRLLMESGRYFGCQRKGYQTPQGEETVLDNKGIVLDLATTAEP